MYNTTIKETDGFCADRLGAGSVPLWRSSGKEARSWLLLVFAASVGVLKNSAGLPQQFLRLFGEPFLFFVMLISIGAIFVIEVTAEQLRQIQLTELEMLVEVDRICRKCGIHYNIIAGTLLGAVRHGGFIPWDDDADVAFLRPDYEKFRVACETDLDTSRFYFQDHRNTLGYRWGYGKLRRKGTLFLREHQEHMPYEQGIFIDIFPLDNVPDNYILRCLHNFHCFCIRKALWAEVGKIADRNMLKRIIYNMVSKISLSTIFSHYETFAKKGNATSTKMVRILTFPTPNDAYGYEKSWYERSEDILFEGKVFRGIKDYDAYLSFKFGDYMTLPLLADRKVHPVSRLKLLTGGGV